MYRLQSIGVPRSFSRRTQRLNRKPEAVLRLRHSVFGRVHEAAVLDGPRELQKWWLGDAASALGPACSISVLSRNNSFKHHDYWCYKYCVERLILLVLLFFCGERLAPVSQ